MKGMVRKFQYLCESPVYIKINMFCISKIFYFETNIRLLGDSIIKMICIVDILEKIIIKRVNRKFTFILSLVYMCFSDIEERKVY